jgi:hypothetical protein
MTHEIELGYLVLEVHDPEILRPGAGERRDRARHWLETVPSSPAKRVGVSTCGVGPTGATTADLRDGNTAVSARRDHDGV